MCTSQSQYRRIGQAQQKYQSMSMRVSARGVKLMYMYQTNKTKHVCMLLKHRPVVSACLDASGVLPRPIGSKLRVEQRIHKIPSMFSCYDASPTGPRAAPLPPHATQM